MSEGRKSCGEWHSREEEDRGLLVSGPRVGMEHVPGGKK